MLPTLSTLWQFPASYAVHTTVDSGVHAPWTTGEAGFCFLWLKHHAIPFEIILGRWLKHVTVAVLPRRTKFSQTPLRCQSFASHAKRAVPHFDNEAVMRQFGKQRRDLSV